MRGVDDSPPPTRTANPSRPPFGPGWRAPTNAMQLISGALHWSVQDAIVILCLRGDQVLVMADEVVHDLLKLRPTVEQLVRVDARHGADR